MPAAAHQHGGRTTPPLWCRAGRAVRTMPGPPLGTDLGRPSQRAPLSARLRDAERLMARREAATTRARARALDTEERAKAARAGQEAAEQEEAHANQRLETASAGLLKLLVVAHRAHGAANLGRGQMSPGRPGAAARRPPPGLLPGQPRDGDAGHGHAVTAPRRLGGPGLASIRDCAGGAHTGGHGPGKGPMSRSWEDQAGGKGQTTLAGRPGPRTGRGSAELAGFSQEPPIRGTAATWTSARPTSRRSAPPRRSACMSSRRRRGGGAGPLERGGSGGSGGRARSRSRDGGIDPAP